MKLGDRLSYLELETLLFSLKDNIEYLKNIYHYNGKWLFRFNTVDCIIENGNINIGFFEQRERKIHSVCQKLRQTIVGKKVYSVDIVKNDRTLVFKFMENFLVVELFAKGNILLLDKDRSIIVLTRIYNDTRHNQKYEWKEVQTEFKLRKCIWKNEKCFDCIENSEGIDIIDAMKVLYDRKNIKKEKPQIDKVERNKKYQIEKLNKSLQTLNEQIDSEKNSQNFKELEIIHTKRKKLEKKLNNATQSQKEKVSESKTNKVNIMYTKWYHKYYWWFTKNNFLVVGGKNADENDYLVKNHLKPNDYYFHCEDFGSGSFILFTENKEPDIIDLDETAEGVLSLSKYWGLSGNVFYVKGNQVSLKPPSGMSLSKGSFMIYGQKNTIKVSQTILGYTLQETTLMLAPYRICHRIDKNSLKIKPNLSRKKGISKTIKTKLNINVEPHIYIFNKPCKI
jgi:predicted ribosome quality control (RQC) complex YloA/Tae2 family protein